jgi:hypothetical protein
MSRISIKGVLIGGVVDISASVLLIVPFAVFAILRVGIANLPKDGAGNVVTEAMHGNVPLYMAQMAVGLGCSALGGYLAGRIAKHDELLNGALSSFLCLSLGIATLASGNDSHSLSMKVLLLIASPTFALIGGYLALMLRRKNTAAQASEGAITKADKTP